MDDDHALCHLTAISYIYQTPTGIIVVRSPMTFSGETDKNEVTTRKAPSQLAVGCDLIRK